MDGIDRIIDALNEAIPEVPFVRDAADMDTPEDWGAVELTGMQSYCADGQMTDMEYKADVWICVADREADMLTRVQAALAEMEDEWFLEWEMPERHYMYDMDRAVWKFAVRYPKLLADEEPEGRTDNGQDTDAGD